MPMFTQTALLYRSPAAADFASGGQSATIDASVVIGMVDKPVLAKAMKLTPEQHVILAQPVGYPKE